MKKNIRACFSCLFLLVFISACSGLQIKREVTADNIFVANDPTLSISVNPELKYIGNPNEQGSSESIGGRRLRASLDNYCFVKSAGNRVQRSVTIQIQKTETSYVSDFFRSVKNTIDKGVTECGGKKFQYYTVEIYPSLKYALTQFIADQGYTMDHGLMKVFGRIYGARENTLVKILYFEDISQIDFLKNKNWERPKNFTAEQYDFYVGFNERAKAAFQVLK